MNKLWLVARHEYIQHVQRKTFLAATFGVPLLLAGAFAVLILLVVNAQQVKALGYVDHAGLLAGQPATVLVSNNGVGGIKDPAHAIPITRYADEPAARAALDAGQIDVYFVLPANYATSGKVTGYAPTQVSQVAQDRFNALLRQALLDSLPGADPRLAAPIVTLSTRTADGRPSNPVAAFLLPLIYGLLFYIVSISAGNYLLMSLVEEKENRVIEMLATSLRPTALMAGKIIGLGLLGLTQLLVWVATAGLVVGLGHAYVSFFADITVPWDSLLLMLALFLPSYLLFAGTMCAIGAAVPAKKEAGQVSNLISLPGAIPVWFILSLLQDPNGPLALVLSFFPYTAPVTLLIRAGAVPIPAWQIGLVLAIQVTAALGMIWVAGRLLRYGMLRYGQRLALRELGRALRGA